MNELAQPIEQTANAQEEPTLQDIERKHFAYENIEQGNEYAQSAIALAEKAGVEPVLNFDPEQDFPEGYGLAILPLTERVPERGNVTKGLCIAAIPSVAQVLETDSGQSWVTKQITDAMIRQVVSSAKPKDESAVASLPLKVEDFTTSSRSSGLAGFNAVASIYVRALKEKGLQFINKGLLKQVLVSSSFAESQFPRIAQENWVTVLQSMITHAAKEGFEAGNLSHWLKTRDQVEVSTADIDLSDIEDMV